MGVNRLKVGGGQKTHISIVRGHTLVRDSCKPDPVRGGSVLPQLEVDHFTIYVQQGS